MRQDVLEKLQLSTGKKARLHRLLFEHGPKNGTLLFLPIDQGLEHGPRDFFPNPPSKNPDYQLRIAEEGNFSAIVFHIGIAEKHMHRFAGRVPLVLKLNGKTEIPNDKEAFSPQTATVEDAVRLGADAVGYTLYVGSPSQDRDFVQFRKIREDAERYGMPVIVWSYPRGEAVEQKGGKDSFYAIDYAARTASELGADVIKLNIPKIDKAKAAASPKPYSSLDVSQEEALRQVIASAGRSLVVFAGGEKENDEELIHKAKLVIDAGADGLIFGRNIWQRPHEEAIAAARRIHAMLESF